MANKPKGQKKVKRITKLGRPTKYIGKEMLPKIEKFVKDRVSKTVIPTIEGLAVELRLNPDTIYDWKKKHRTFSESIGDLLAVQADMLQTLGLGGEYNASMAAFLLKNNHKFKDKHEVDHTTKGKEMPAPILGGASTVVKTE